MWKVYYEYKCICGLEKCMTVTEPTFMKLVFSVGLLYQNVSKWHENGRI
jgi:hypothetical protein